MSFFSDLITRIRGINQAATIQNNVKSYIFGVILTGTYSNWKSDPHPTFLCLGTYAKNGKMYVHGIQLHAIGEGNTKYIMNTILNMKKNGIVTNPLMFFQYLRTNNPYIVTEGYRTYLIEHSNFKIANAGLTNIQGKFSSDDQRDSFLMYLNPQPAQRFIDINTLKENITRVINTVKVW